MRAFVVVTIIVIAVFHGQSLASHGMSLAEGSASDPFLEPAIELRCADVAAEAYRACESELRRSFDAGTRKPEAVVRQNCSYFENGWAAAPSERARICGKLSELLAGE